MSETHMSEYIKGFDSGFDYVILELVQLSKLHPEWSDVLARVIVHLTSGESTEDLAEKITSAIAATMPTQ